jgi:endonuclease/exonuclease/phosphatase family metal-dependent hydrolase
VLAAGYADAWRRLHDDGGGGTFPAWDPHLRLDYVFAPETEAGCIRRCDVVASAGVAQASDHLPLLAEIDLDAVQAPSSPW